ncbi:hypothetical protein TNCV_1571021 [Trichonephila clavipes]|uniref:Uncharacterized protein n=1 Tax=Trichonephila clavipes TaxID=2585209 RepID=A0A8X6SVQ5_TRICX|nr:hypothetical protein TNCV_1571021 [Trichonephila clavipes]
MFQRLPRQLCESGLFIASTDGRGRSRTVRQTHLEEVILDHVNETPGKSTRAVARRLPPPTLGEAISSSIQPSFVGGICRPILFNCSRVAWVINDRRYFYRITVRILVSLKTYRVEDPDTGKICRESKSTCWRDAKIWREGCKREKITCLPPHLTEVENNEIDR